MAGKRKRRRSGRGDRGDQGDSKRQRISGALNSKDPIVKQAVLAQYYPRVLSLRQYLLSKLPSASKIRKKKILSVGRSPRPDGKDETVFSNFLDQTLVGVIEQKEVSSEERIQQWTSFSQRADTSDFANLSGVSIFSQSEVRTFESAHAASQIHMQLLESHTQLLTTTVSNNLLDRGLHYMAVIPKVSSWAGQSTAPLMSRVSQKCECQSRPAG